ncbi:MAG TPA: hypothetical protein VGW80_02290 [Solirubrobacterales bacterium]|nr:hypothetical protein [Solirubrobacterales bacterium]
MGKVVEDATPAEAVVAVVSKGDPRLVEFAERSGRHFPTDAEGRYAGYYPRTSEEAIAQLEAARAGGAEFLCLPKTAFWWLEHYAALATWLGIHCRVVADDRETCVVYDLLASPLDAAAAGDAASPNRQLRALLDAVLPEEALLFAIGLDGEGLDSPGRTVAPLGRGNLRGLERRLEAASTSAAFVLVSKREHDPPLDPDLERLLGSAARPVASRAGLCELYEVKPPPGTNRVLRSSRSGEKRSRPTSYLDGAAADKLTRRLERLGLAGDDGQSPASRREVQE